MTDDTIQTAATHTVRPESIAAIRAAIVAHRQLREQYRDVSESSRILLLDGYIVASEQAIADIALDLGIATSEVSP